MRGLDGSLPLVGFSGQPSSKITCLGGRNPLKSRFTTETGRNRKLSTQDLQFCRNRLSEVFQRFYLTVPQHKAWVFQFVIELPRLYSSSTSLKLSCDLNSGFNYTNTAGTTFHSSYLPRNNFAKLLLHPL